MYIAMNRFRVAKGREQEFIDIWKNRIPTGLVTGFGISFASGSERRYCNLVLLSCRMGIGGRFRQLDPF